MIPPFTEAEQQDYDAWLATRPKVVREVAEKFPPRNCYRLKGTKGHYTIHGFGEKNNGKVTLMLTHGEDSTLPGVQVFGIKPEEVELCGCLDWDWPTKESAEATIKKLDFMKTLMGFDS